MPRQLFAADQGNEALSEEALLPVEPVEYAPVFEHAVESLPFGAENLQSATSGPAGIFIVSCQPGAQTSGLRSGDDPVAGLVLFAGQLHPVLGDKRGKQC